MRTRPRERPRPAEYSARPVPEHGRRPSGLPVVPRSSSSVVTIGLGRAAPNRAARAAVRASAAATRAVASGPPRRGGQRRGSAGTVHRRGTISGRVYCGCSRRPVANESPACEASSMTPGTRRDHRVDEHQRGQLAAGEHVVADAHLAVRPAHGPARRSPRSDHRPGRGAGWAASSRASASVSGTPAGSMRTTCAPSASQRLDGRVQRLGAHHHPGSPAVRLVVHGPMTPEAVLAQVVDRELEQATLGGATDDRGAQRRLEQAGKRVTTSKRIGQRTSSACVVDRPSGRRRGRSRARRPGCRARAARRLALRSDTPPLRRRGRSRPASPSSAPATSDHPQALELVPVVAALGQRRGLDLEVAPDERLRRLPSVDTRRSSSDGMPAAELDRGDTVRGSASPSTKRLAPDAMRSGPVGEQLESQAAAQALDAADAGDRETRRWLSPRRRRSPARHGGRRAVAMTRSRLRMAFAMRPSRPMTRPMSRSSTPRTRTISSASSSSISTVTASGLLDEAARDVLEQLLHSEAFVSAGSAVSAARRWLPCRGPRATREPRRQPSRPVGGIRRRRPLGMRLVGLAALALRLARWRRRGTLFGVAAGAATAGVPPMPA